MMHNMDRPVGYVLLVVSVLALVVGYLLQQRDARRAAMRRHPSSRQATPDFTSEAARKYHTDNSPGRN